MAAFAWQAGGNYQLDGHALSDFPVDRAGHTFLQSGAMEHALTLRASAEWDAFAGDLWLQAARGFLTWRGPDARFLHLGAPEGRDGSAFTDLVDQLWLRRASVRWRTPYGQVRLGRGESQWGLGLVANGGSEAPAWGAPSFGADRGVGDLVDRLSFATKPFGDAVLVALAADVVARDDRISRPAGDLALQGVAAVLYDQGEQKFGIYGAYRALNDREDDNLTAWVVDLYADLQAKLPNLRLHGASELAWISGRTTMARNNAFLGDSKVAQLGGVVRAGAEYVPWRAGSNLEVGYASGDGNGNDDRVRAFSFDVAYQPSLILFRRLQSAMTLASAANASDPARVGVAPDAVRLLPSQGAVQNALYIQPTLHASWEWLRGRLSLLWARAAQDVFDPFNSNAYGGGTARNFRGGSGAERQLGWELDVGVDATWHWLRVALQAGTLWPGKAFADAGGGRVAPIHAAFLRLGLDLDAPGGNAAPPPQKPPAR
jgi:hypothetical protein